MEPADLKNIESEIKKIIAELQSTILYLKDASKPVEPSCALGRLTRMEAIGEKGVNEAMLRSSKERLTRLENALLRIDSGKYGICVKCGKEIPSGRLNAVPEVLVCVECAGR